MTGDNLTDYMKKKFRLFIFVLIALTPMVFLPSCKTYEFFSMDVLEPAKVEISTGIKRVLVAHNFNIANRDTSGIRYQIYDQVVYDTLYIDTLLGRYAINSLSEKLNTIGRFETIAVDSTGWVFPADHDLFTQEDVKHIRQLCEENKADAMILLNSANRYVLYDMFYSDFGGYFGDFSVFMMTKWLFINPFYSKLLDEIRMVDTVSFQSGDFLFEYGFETEDIRNDYMMETFSEIATRYSDRISPHYATTDRIIFTKGNKYLKKGYKEALLGNWDKASEIWDKSLVGQEPRNLSKACFNLALASEMNGNLSDALEWANESYRLFADTINHIYIYILKDRLEEQDKILKQMKNEN